MRTFFFDGADARDGRIGSSAAATPRAPGVMVVGAAGAQVEARARRPSSASCSLSRGLARIACERLRLHTERYATNARWTAEELHHVEGRTS